MPSSLVDLEPLVFRLLAPVAMAALVLAWNAWKAWQVQRGNIDRQVNWAVAELGLVTRNGTRSSGRVDGVAIDFVTELPRATEDGVQNRGLLLIEATDRLDLPVRLSAEGLSTWLGAQDLTLGEQRFDDAVHVRTQDEALARALLDGPTRDAVVKAVEAGLSFEEGRWHVEAVVSDWPSDRIVATAKAVAAAQKAFATAADRVRRRPALHGVARTDRHAGVRARALDLLIQRGQADRDTLLDRCRDVDANVRLIAAKALGPDGVDTLLDQVRTGSRTIRIRAATALGESRHLAVEVAREVEECLLGALSDPELARHALLGLGRSGTGRAVEPLKRAVATGHDAEVRRLAQQVLDTVRARLDPTASGALSLVEVDAGGLALAEPSAGAVSVAKGRIAEGP